MDTQYSKLIGDLQSYLSKRYDLFLVRVLEKVSILLGLLISLVVVLFLASVVVIFGGIALAYVLGQWLPMWAAYLIIGAVFLLLLVLAVVFRRQWFINPIVALLSTILFSSTSDGNTPAGNASSPLANEDTHRKEDCHD